MKHFYISALLFFLSFQAAAQLPPACTINNPPLAKQCNQACILCELDGYASATTQTVQGQIIPGYCTQVVHSMGYVGFVAGSTNLSIEVTIGTCTLGNSIEMGIYQTDDCQNFELVGDCNTAMFTGNSYILSNTTPLVPGCPYFLVTDNNGPAACAFTVSVIAGSGSAPTVDAATVPVGPTKVCPGSTVEYTIPPIFGACQYRWSAPAGTLINGAPSPVILNHNEGTTVTVTWGSQGGQLCVRGSNPCSQGTQACLPVIVSQIPPTILPPVSICAGESFEWVDGNFYATTQLLSFTYVTPLGCDSVIRQQLTVQPPIISNIGVLRVCAGDCVTVGFGTYCTSGSFQETIAAVNGCDSTIFFSVLVVQTAAVISPADTLSCLQDTIVLYSTGSTPGGNYTWQDSSGNTLSTADSLFVSTPGVYRLIVEHSAAGLTCRDTAVTTVFSSQQLPNLTATGDSLTCIQPTGQLQANSTTPGVIFFWQGPGNFQSNLPAPGISAAGTYFIQATAPNGCSKMDSVQVVSDVIPPLLTTTMSDTLDCLVDSVLLTGQTNSTGSNFSWSGPQNFSANLPSISTTLPGQYSLIVTAPNGCTATDTLLVLIDTLTPGLTVLGDTITCLNTTAQLSANSTPASAAISWSGPQNFSSNQPTPTTQVPGIYQVLATASNGCTAIATTTVFADTLTPQITVSGGTLTCAQDSLLLTSSVQPSNSTLAWTGPQGFSSNLPDPSVTIFGDYTLTATGTNGCTALATAMVTIDTMLPQISAQGDTLTCTQNTGMLTLNFSPANSAISWMGPQGFSSSQASPVVTLSGQYMVTVTAANGCSSTAEVLVVPDATIPQITANGDTITCSQNAVQLSAQVVPSGSNLAWTGPLGFSSALPNPVVSTPGQYILTATTANGCTASANIQVVADTSAPLLNLTGGIISCLQPNLNLGAVFSPTNANINWSGPQGFSSNQPTPNITLSGNYTAIVTADNGCSTLATVFIAADTSRPQLSATGGTLNCIQTSLVLLSSLSPASSSVVWSGPQGFTSNQPNPTTALAGNYQITATAPNGCTATATAAVTIDTLPPQLNANGNTLTCLQTTVPVTVISVPANTQILWSGPQGFMATTAIANVSTPGAYAVVSTANNGCTTTATVEVLIDTLSPVVDALGGLLTCVQNSLILTAMVSPAGSTVEWSGPQGFSSTLQNPEVSIAGTYVLTATSSNGCTNSASAVVTADSDFPVISLSGGTISCMQTTVNLSSVVTPAGASLNWTGPQNFNSTQANPLVNIAGVYLLTATTSAGCTATATTTVLLDTVAPQASTTGAVLNCQQPTASILVNFSPANSTLLWQGPQNFNSTLPNPVINTPGLYLAIITGANGCTTTATATVSADTLPPQVLAADGLLTCLQNQLALNLSLQPTGSTVLWTGPQNFNSTQLQPVVGTPGTYTVLATAPNGCTASTTVQVIADTDLPVISSTGGTITCAQANVVLTATVTPSGALLAWSGPQNFSSNQPAPIVSVPGSYLLVATLANGCSASATTIVESDLALPELTVFGDDITCRTPTAQLTASIQPSNSTIVWTGPQGFNSTIATPVVSIAGMYTLVATAPNGCSQSASVEVEAFDQPMWTLSLGPDIEVEEYEAVFPHPITTLPVTEWTEIAWDFPSHVLGMSCQTCPYPLIKLAESGTVGVEITDANGCTQVASYQIQVQQTSAIYIPNIFNPEGTAGNQRFEFFIGATARVIEVRNFKIFDRWGNLVHERPPFAANDPAHGWDGFVRGKKALPGVYVWYAEFEFANGRIKQLKGDVTLYR